MTKLNKINSIIFFAVIISFFIFLPTQNTHAFFGGAIDFLSDLASGASNAVIGAIIWSMGAIAGMIIEFMIGFGNTILKFAIDGMGDPTGSGVVVVEEGWKIVRNLANSALVIGLVIIAINIILGKEEGTAKKTLVNFVIVALLINFTPLICGLIIQGSQIIALSFIGTGVDMDSANRILSIAKSIQEGVENPLWLIPGLISLLVFAILYFTVCILYSILFIVRTVILWILIIASPIALATKVFPKSDIVMKFFPSILYWDEWYKMFVQWVVIIIPAGLFLHLSNLSMQSVVASPVSYVGATGAIAIIQTTFAAMSSYLTPIIILLVGFMITISSGGQVAAPIGALANKAKGLAIGVAKDGAKGMVGGYLDQREEVPGKERKGRLASIYGTTIAKGAWSVRETGRQHFEEAVDGIHADLDYKKRRESAGKKKDTSEAEADIEKIIRAAADKVKAAPAEKAAIERERDVKIMTTIKAEAQKMELEIKMAQGKGDIERTKMLQKNLVLFLAKNVQSDAMLKEAEDTHDVKLEDIAKKLSGRELLKAGDSFLKNKRVAGSLSNSSILQVMRNGSPSQQSAIMEGAASINLDDYNKGTKEYNQARDSKANLYAQMNKSKTKADESINKGGDELNTGENNAFLRLREVRAARTRIAAKAVKDDKDKKDYENLDKEVESLRKEIDGIRSTRGGRHYP